MGQTCTAMHSRHPWKLSRAAAHRGAGLSTHDGCYLGGNGGYSAMVTLSPWWLSCVVVGLDDDEAALCGSERAGPKKQ